jgi:hypothetical protein
MKLQAEEKSCSKYWKFELGINKRRKIKYQKILTLGPNFQGLTKLYHNIAIFYTHLHSLVLPYLEHKVYDILKFIIVVV